jgi:predicted ATPase
LRSILLEIPEDKADNYPFNIAALRNLEELQFHPDVTFFVGENGTGKSTLLESIAQLMKCGGQGGTGNFSLADSSGLSEMHQYMRVKRGPSGPRDRFFLRAESLYNVGTYLEELANDPDARTTPEQVFRRYGGKSLHHQSHGESFIAVLTNTFGGNGLYLLDEPEAALSPQRQMAALVRIHDLVQANSQFVIATHSPILMAYPNSIIYLFDEQGCHRVKYEETEHLQVTLDFLQNYPKRLQQLLSDRPAEDD